MLEQKEIYAVLKNNLSLLEGLEFTPPSSARTKGDDTRYYVYTYWYVYQHFLFDFPFDEINGRLLFSLSGVLFRPWTHTSDDSYIYQLSLVVATATVSFLAPYARTTR